MLQIAVIGSPSVALYTSAWIEIISMLRVMLAIDVALYTSAWIEINRYNYQTLTGVSRTLHECVD